MQQMVLTKDIFTCPTQPLLAESPGMLKAIMTKRDKRIDRLIHIDALKR